MIASDAKSVVEECHIELDVLDFRSTALLFGSASKHISNNDYTMVRSAEEFADLVEPPFLVTKSAKTLTAVATQRRAEIFGRMGNGLPSEVIAAAEHMTKDEFEELVHVARRPEIGRFDSTAGLESEIYRWTLFKELALTDKNYKRASDLAGTIEQLEGMRCQFPSLKELKEEEQMMKSDLSDAVSKRRYDIANELKKDLLALKKKIMKERRMKSNRLAENQKEKLSNFQSQINSMMENTNIESTDDDYNTYTIDEKNIFDVNCDGRSCKFVISCGSIYDVKSDIRNGSNTGIVCWSNEAFDSEITTTDGSPLTSLEGEQLQKDLVKLPVLEETEYGPIRCITGKALTILTSIQGSIILAVGPYRIPSNKTDALLEGDDDFFDYSITALRSCYRSCIGQANHTGLHVLAISPVTTQAKSRTGRAYNELVQIGLQTLSEEVKFSQLKEVHIMARSEKEAATMAITMEAMGYKSAAAH